MSFVGNEMKTADGKQSGNSIEVEQKPEELPKQESEKVPEQTGEGGKPEDEEEIPTVPLEVRNMTADNLLANANDIPEIKLKKLTINETEENAYKLGPKAQESELIFAFEKEHGVNRSSMFGGDILLAADIFEELSNYMQGQTEMPSPLEIKVSFEGVLAKVAISIEALSHALFVYLETALFVVLKILVHSSN